MELLGRNYGIYRDPLRGSEHAYWSDRARVRFLLFVLFCFCDKRTYYRWSVTQRCGSVSFLFGAVSTFTGKQKCRIFLLRNKTTNCCISCLYVHGSRRVGGRGGEGRVSRNALFSLRYTKDKTRLHRRPHRTYCTVDLWFVPCDWATSTVRKDFTERFYLCAAYEASNHALGANRGVHGFQFLGLVRQSSIVVD